MTKVNLILLQRATRKSPTRFQSVPNSTTLDDFEGL